MRAGRSRRSARSFSLRSSGARELWGRCCKSDRHSKSGANGAGQKRARAAARTTSNWPAASFKQIGRLIHFRARHERAQVDAAQPTDRGAPAPHGAQKPPGAEGALGQVQLPIALLTRPDEKCASASASAGHAHTRARHNCAPCGRPRRAAGLAGRKAADSSADSGGQIRARLGREMDGPEPAAGRAKHAPAPSPLGNQAPIGAGALLAPSRPQSAGQ